MFDKMFHSMNNTDKEVTKINPFLSSCQQFIRIVKEFHRCKSQFLFQTLFKISSNSMNISQNLFYKYTKINHMTMSQANQREEEYKNQIKTLTTRLKEVHKMKRHSKNYHFFAVLCLRLSVILFILRCVLFVFQIFTS